MTKGKTNQSLKSFWQKYWIYLIPVVMCCLVMLPRFLDPQFGLMDDGDVIQKAHMISDGQWGVGSETGAGRFRPLYWYIHYFIFLLFGANPAGFFLVNFLALVLLVVGVIKLLKVYGSTNITILIACAFFLLSGPIAESYYTLSKYEIFQLVFLVYAILMAEKLTNAKSLISKILLGGGVLLFSLVSYLIKETSLIMPVVYLGWIIVCLIKKRGQKAHLNHILVLLGASIAAGLIYYFWRSVYFSEMITQGSYVGNHVDLSIAYLLNSFVGWEAWLRRDFSFSVILVLTYCLGLILRKTKPVNLGILLGLLIWMTGWLSVFLPWSIKIEYYLLPFALGCSILSAHVLVELLSGIRTDMVWKRITLIIGIGCAGIFFINSLALIVSNARYQLLMDSVNGRMMKYLAEVLPEDGIVYVNLPAENEYVKEIGLHFQYFYSRPDVRVDRFYFQAPETNNIEDGSLIISPVVRNRPIYSTRHAFNEDDSTRWTYTIEKFMADGIAEPVIFSGEFSQLEPHIFRIICPVMKNIGPCNTTPQIIEKKQLIYQWHIYRYERSLENAAQAGIYQCGLWTLRHIDGTESTLNFGGCSDTPVVGDWNGDGISDLGIHSPSTNEWQIDWNFDARADLTFTLEKMNAGDIPVLGDWDGDGRGTPGFIQKTGMHWHLYDGSTGNYSETRSIQGGADGALPLIGDWNLDSKDSWGVYLPATGEINLENVFEGTLSGVDYTLPVNTFVIVGDWYGTGRDTLAFIDGSDWVISPVNCACSFSNYPDRYRFPIGEGIPISGIWPQ
jgi:hypothetical protein